MQVIDVRNESGAIGELIPRAAVDIAAAEDTAQALIDSVRDGGESAVLAIGERLDGVRPPKLRVPQDVIDHALADLDPEVVKSLNVAIDRVRSAHGDQLPDVLVSELAPGATVSQRWVPVDRVGLYVPGGRAVYPSSVVMNVVPAQLAGVRSIAVVSPPQKDFGGWPHPTILAAAALLGVDEVYATGGAQAIAWLAYGSQDGPEPTCPPVSVITGPGNIYVTAAKRILSGTVGIDSEAGPTEIMILADETATPTFVAADLISQAEHDVLAASVLVTDSEELATAVQQAVVQQVASTKHRDRVTESLTGAQSAIVLVRDIQQGLAAVNAYGAEHLEVQTANATEVAAQVRNAGAVFVGPWTPVSLGDYCAGSNHVLPTGGCACYSSGLSVYSFLRSMQVVDYSAAALRVVAGDVETLSNAEDLPAHGDAIRVRLANDGEST